MSASNSYEVIIAGAGPAGTSAAIHLANAGMSVLIVEKKKFPRPKLCGEFISPECWHHFTRLGVAEQMQSSGGAYLNRTVFYSRNGRSVEVPSDWFGGNVALGLSRAEMDNNLLMRARDCGVTILEETQVCGLLLDEGVVRGVSTRTHETQKEFFASVTIDATGRARVLSRMLTRTVGNQDRIRSRPGLVAFKSHLKHTRVAQGACEIYVYPGGYGGLNSVEGDDVSNFCFIVSARDARRCASDPERVIREVVSRNSRAAFTLGAAVPTAQWLGVSLERFGRETLVAAPGLLNAGDAAAFIDPFTGSGMLMALENGEIVAAAISCHRQHLKEHSRFDCLGTEYRERHSKKFDSRLRISSWMRRAAFVPELAEALIFIFSNDWMRHKLSDALRRGSLDSAKLRLNE